MRAASPAEAPPAAAATLAGAASAAAVLPAVQAPAVAEPTTKVSICFPFQPGPASQGPGFSLPARDSQSLIADVY